MPRVKLELPPGQYRNGTTYQAAGRWRDATLMRWYQGIMRPVGGWIRLQATVAASEIFDTGGVQTDIADFVGSPVFQGWTDLDPLSMQINTSNLVIPQKDESGMLSGANWDFRDNIELFMDINQTADTASTGDGISLVMLSDKDETGLQLFPTGIVMTLQTVPAAARTDVLVSTKDTESGGQIDFMDFGNTLGIDDGESFRFGMTYEHPNVEVWREPFGGGTRTTIGNFNITADLRGNPNRSRMRVTTFGGSSVVPWNIERVGVTLTKEAAFTVGPVPRAMHGWEQTGGLPFLGIGTHQGLFAWTLGVLFDITPNGFTTGRQDTGPSGGAVPTGSIYGRGFYNVGVYGSGDQTVLALDADIWHLDNFGEFLVGCMVRSDNKIYSWDPATPTTKAVALEDDPSEDNVPRANRGIVVTPERFLVALGADGNSRRVHWASQESLLDFNVTKIDNTSGLFDLPTTGSLVAGRRGNGETLLWTTAELWSMNFVGSVLVYGFNQRGENCGLISPEATVEIDSGFVWMGSQNFYLYNGVVRVIPCEVWDHVFPDFNRAQSIKVNATVDPDYAEVRWHYPSEGVLEPDRYVTWNYRDNTWYTGNLRRSCGVSQGTISATPAMADDTGQLYLHESGISRFDVDGTTRLIPFAKTGPLEIGDGDRAMHITEFIPDERTRGQVELEFTSRFYPQGTERTYPVVDSIDSTPVRIHGRQIEIKVIEKIPSDFRVGDFRFETKNGGRR